MENSDTARPCKAVRQMPELVERGHIDIGQSPLCQLNADRKALYLEEGRDFAGYLMRIAPTATRCGRRNFLKEAGGAYCD